MDEEGQAYLNDLIASVDVVLQTAFELQQVIPGGDLGTEQVSTFASLAKQLQQQATDIKQHAENMQTEEMNQAFLQMNQTCITCHSLFRGL